MDNAQLTAFTQQRAAHAAAMASAALQHTADLDAMEAARRDTLLAAERQGRDGMTSLQKVHDAATAALQGKHDAAMAQLLTELNAAHADALARAATQAARERDAAVSTAVRDAVASERSVRDALDAAWTVKLQDAETELRETCRRHECALAAAQAMHDEAMRTAADTHATHVQSLQQAWRNEADEKVTAHTC